LSPLPDPSPAGTCPLSKDSAPRSPRRYVVALAALLTCLCVAGPRALADDEPSAPAAPDSQSDEQVFDFTGLDIGGRLRTPQLLYFLDRAREELRQASLERRSFIPEMVRSIDEESL
jgi:hypothetical protein